MNATFEDRLILDNRNIRELVHNVLEEVHQLRVDSFIARIFQDKDIDSIRNWEELLSKRIEQPFSLVIMGDFKRGKSTLINAILGKSTVITNVTPETITINRVKYGEIPQVEAILSNGSRVRLEQNELSREMIESLAKQFPAQIDHIDISEKNEILRDICITDTPGLGDVLKLFDRKVQDYIVNADAIIYVVSALSPLSESEQQFLASVLSPQRLSRLFVVVNFADCLDSEGEIEKITNLVLERARVISPSSVVYPISALDEFNRKTGRKAPNPEIESYLNISFRRFESMLEHDLLLNKDIVRGERIAILLKMMLKDIRDKISSISILLTEQIGKLAEDEQRYNDDLANINSRLSNAKKILTDLTKSLCTMAEEWMQEYLLRLKSELQSLGKLPAQELQKHLQFYLMDMIRDASTRCLKVHRQVIEEETCKQFAVLAGNKIAFTEGHDIEVAVDLADISWTIADSSIFYIQNLSFYMGNGFVANLAGALGGFWREAKVKKSSDKIINALLDNYSDIENSCMVQLRKMYVLLAEQAEKHIEETYNTHIHKSLDMLRQVQNILQDKSIKKEDVEEKLAFATRILDHMDQLVNKSGFFRQEH